VIHVTHGWDEQEGKQDAKTHAGHRSVPIPEALRVIIAEWLLVSGRWGDDLLLGRTASLPFAPSTLRARAHKAWERAGLDPLTPHEARHVAASFLLAAGVPLSEVSRYVGHTDFRTTANTYGHLVQGREQEAARRLDDLLDGGVRESR
jgi:integrase